MLQLNTLIVYGTTGVCRVEDKKTERFDGKKHEFYILKPVNDQKSTILLPTDSVTLLEKVRELLTRQQVCDLIDSLPDNKSIWIDNDRLRSDSYKKILDSGDRTEIIKVIQTLYLHKKKLAENGKKLHAADDTICERAEKLLFDEFAIVLGIKREAVPDFIDNHLNNYTNTLPPDKKAI